MTSRFTRREFVRDSAALSTSLAVGGALNVEAADIAAYASRWHLSPERVWAGPEFWTNPLQDWRIVAGRLECIKAAHDRNVHLLTRQLGEKSGDLQMAVRLGRIDGPMTAGQGSAGFRIGIMGPLGDYRNSLLFGSGLDAGVTAQGGLFIGDPQSATAIHLDAASRSLELRLSAQPQGEQYSVVLAAYDPATAMRLGEVRREDIPARRLIGNLALVANFGAPQKGRTQTNKAARSDPGLGKFWFADWRVTGDKVETHEDRAFGPILFSQYTLSGGVLKMTAQMPPLGKQDSPVVGLEISRGGRWTRVGEENIHAEARTATFRVENWNAEADAAFRLCYTLKSNNGTAAEHYWTGTVRRDPVDQDMLTVANVSCNWHAAFPNSKFVANMARLNPDLLAFTGDQFYEPSGGYGVQRTPLNAAILDLLRKWYLHGWTWRDLSRDRPSISLPDDHDVYQGNVWGEAGEPRHGTQEMGGYDMPPAWVNVVHRIETSHHPDPFDPTPVKHGISVYYGALTYGRVSFAILADRQFKSGPEAKCPPPAIGAITSWIRNLIRKRPICRASNCSASDNSRSCAPGRSTGAAPT